MLNRQMHRSILVDKSIQYSSSSSSPSPSPPASAHKTRFLQPKLKEANKSLLINTPITIQEGFNEATLRSFPKVLYSKAKLRKNTTASCCSICLADYKGTDMHRVLPLCGHLFHVRCVDPWLRLHPTCPVCRNSPAPTP